MFVRSEWSDPHMETDRMYYVTKNGEGLLNYHSRFNDLSKAREYAENLKATYGHNYDVIRVETVWTTQTLDEAMRKVG